MKSEPEPLPPPQTFHFRSALVGDQWQTNVAISINGAGLVNEVQPNCDVDPRMECFDLVALPGMTNVHSHAFQRGFAGLSEFQTATQDSFWTWRELMYRYIEPLSVEDVFIIARQLYLEMILAGYTAVGEFHYLHHPAFHGSDAAENGDPLAMADAIIRAATAAGIGLCLLPSLYQQGGFAGQPLSSRQQRFQLSSDQFIELVTQCANRWRDVRQFKVGLSIHSLRAVNDGDGLEVIHELTGRLGAMPIHLHVAEQMKEVADCLVAFGQRPVERLMSRYAVNQDWCLIHATHLSDQELDQILASNAVVGLCPTTEANLGDGFFRIQEFLERGGQFAIGSDSHCSVDLRDELRTLEYGQRLVTQRRAVLGTAEWSTGRRLYQAAVEGGAQAIGLVREPKPEAAMGPKSARSLGLPGVQRNRFSIGVGQPANLTLIDPRHPAIAEADGDRLLDRLIFSNLGNPVAGVMVGGQLILTASDSFRTAWSESAEAFLQLGRRHRDFD